MTKILVIDDEPNVRALLDLYLRYQGYEVILAEDGWKGLHLYHQELPDVILLDLKMPGIDGLTILKYIRSFDVNQPVIIYSGNTNPKTEREVRAMGLTEFVLKDSPLSFLTDVLQRLLKTPASGAAPSLLLTRPAA
jgi:CheY-like chemotaxis protein